jgi:predicted nicotinamide N-methyase
VISEDIGRIKNIRYDAITNDMEIVIVITDNKFKKKIIRDMSLAGKIEFDGDTVLFTSNIGDNNDG